MGLAKAIKRGASALLIGSMMAGLFTGCSATGENSGGKLVKIAVCVSDQTPAAQALADVFKPMVEEATDGRYDIQIYNSGVLGSEKVTYDYTKSGIVEMCVVGTTMWSETPKMTIPDFPFLFDSVEHARVCYQGELGEYIAEDLENTQPLKLLSWYPNGARVFTSNKKLESLDDFNGQKLRMPNNPIHVKLAESLGANVVIMDMGEVFTALEQGVADGQDNPLATVKTEGWYEVQDYVYDTNHIIASLELFAGEEFWNSLSEEDQEKEDMIVKFYIGESEDNKVPVNSNINTAGGMTPYGDGKSNIHCSNDEFHLGRTSNNAYKIRLTNMEQFLKSSSGNGYTQNCKLFVEVTSKVTLYGEVKENTSIASINLKQRQLFDLD